jgi:tetratricopeptide (TPR) repeat protein
MSGEDFRSTLATFASVFPHVLLFRAGTTFDYLMIGSNDGWTGGGSPYANAVVDLSPALREGLARLRFDDPSRFSMGRSLSRTRIAAPFQILAGEFVLGDRAFRRFSAGAALNTDDRPSLEFSAPKFLFASEESQIYRSLEAAREEEVPTEVLPDKTTVDAKTVRKVVGGASLAMEDIPRALRLLGAAVARDPADARASTDYARAVFRAGRPEESEKLLLTVVAKTPRFAPAYFHLADLHALRGEAAQAASWAERGLRVDSDDPRANLSAGSYFLGVGRKDAAKKSFERALKAKTLDEDTRRRIRAALAGLR